MSHSLSAEKRLQEERQREDRIKELLESYKQVSTFMCVFFVRASCVRACVRARQNFPVLCGDCASVFTVVSFLCA